MTLVFDLFWALLDSGGFASIGSVDAERYSGGARRFICRNGVSVLEEAA